MWQMCKTMSHEGRHFKKLSMMDKTIFQKVKNFLFSRRFLKPFFAVLAGGLVGFLYYYFVGCNSGNCAITGSPAGSIIFGGLMGLFFVNSPCSSGKC